MNTPIVDFLERYARQNALRLHMPGHKGKGEHGELFDITEISGADVLYSSKGIIKQSEENAAALFSSKRTLYSTEGSSLAIRAMLYIIYMYARACEKPPVVLAGRNAHKSFMTACGLVGIDPQWIYPARSESLISCEITADILDDYLNTADTKPAAVYITSPDYLGNIADISELSAVCKKHDCLLAVDNAHGAYLRFLETSLHPITLGADICCDSAHKTLPVLTGGAYLHLSASSPDIIEEYAETAMSVFASTSPSYLILQSLDAANEYLSQGYSERLSDFTAAVLNLGQRLSAHGYTLLGKEPLKLTVASKSYGYTGEELAEILAAENIECEFADADHLVMMLTPETGECGLDRLCQALLSIPKKTALNQKAPASTPKQKAMSVREAMMSPSEKLEVEKCKGRILASAGVSCPPAIPVVMCGEIIDDGAIEALKYYGHTHCRVVK